MTQHDLLMNRLVITAILGITVLRYFAIGLTPLGLDVEEAQYWQWSTTPDLGYFTKPPMIAWVINIGVTLFGDSTFGVRFMAPLIQAVSALLMMQIASQVYTPLAGRIAAVLWLTLPISALGGFVMSTDSPMLLFLLAALLMLTPIARLEALPLSKTLMAGIFTGLGMMSKYAAIYLPIGLLLWWLWEGRRHRLFTWHHVVVYIVGTIASLLPNLIWNLTNGFVTARHLSHNANLDEPQYNIFGSIEFLVAQLGVIGPIIGLIAIMVIIFQWRIAHAKFWIALFLPAITVISIQGFFSDANANWALASWPAALILLSGYAAQEWRRLSRPVLIGIGINTGIMMVFIAIIIAGSAGPITPKSDPLRRLKAWDNHASDILRFAQAHDTRHIVLFRRGHASKLIWELRNKNMDVAILDRNGIPENHFEQKFAWVPKEGQRSIFINGVDTPPKFENVAKPPQVAWDDISAVSMYQISERRERKLVMHLGQMTSNTQSQ